MLAAFREKALQPEFAQSQGSHERASDALIVALTPRESEVLALLAQRLSNSEIANRLFISPKTVRRHTENIYNKLSVHDRREAVAKGLGLGILG
jgi:DNA-binding NarL/FixJ family response regulator